jgi:lipoprotein signal peptidase
MRKWYGWLIVSLVVIVLDQLTKHAITNAMTFGESRELTSFFNLVLTIKVRHSACSPLHRVGSGYSS